jgi:hypothetical protein
MAIVQILISQNVIPSKQALGVYLYEKYQPDIDGDWLEYQKKLEKR